MQILYHQRLVESAPLESVVMRGAGLFEYFLVFFFFNLYLDGSIQPYIAGKMRVQTLFGRKISNFNQSSLSKQKKGDFLSLRAPKTFPAVKRKHKPPAITQRSEKCRTRSKLLSHGKPKFNLGNQLCYYHIYIYIYFLNIIFIVCISNVYM